MKYLQFPNKIKLEVVFFSSSDGVVESEFKSSVRLSFACAHKQQQRPRDEKRHIRWLGKIFNHERGEKMCSISNSVEGNKKIKIRIEQKKIES